MLTRLLQGLFRHAPKSRARAPRAVDDGQLAAMRFNACADPAVCRGGCCRRGVRMLERDALRIVAFIEANPAHFALLGSVAAPLYRNQVAEGVWIYFTETVTSDGPGRNGVNRAEGAGDVVSDAERRTAHCVFLRPDSRCSLQVAAAALGHHKWAFKPTPCWLFPLRVAFAGERGGARCYRLEHATGRGEMDDAACGRLEPGGAAASTALAEEIARFHEWFPQDPERFVNEVQAGGATVRTDPVRG